MVPPAGMLKVIVSRLTPLPLARKIQYRKSPLEPDPDPVSVSAFTVKAAGTSRTSRACSDNLQCNCLEAVGARRVESNIDRKKLRVRLMIDLGDLMVRGPALNSADPLLPVNASLL